MIGTHCAGSAVLAQTALCVALFVSAAKAHGQTEKVIHSFTTTPPDGVAPVAAMISDKAGNLYGTTVGGGPFGWGTVFEITAAGEEKVLYAFGGKNPEGMHPNAALVFDKAGNLYGTTVDGTSSAGTVFEITTAGTEQVLYTFGSQPGDGTTPYAGLVFDKKGNLYGTTYWGGAHNLGTVFEITTTGAEKVIYSFGSRKLDGVHPYYASLILGTAGRLYGTTSYGGVHGGGTVFQISAAGKEKALYSFGQPGDGLGVYAGVVLDKAGNLYGTTLLGGANGEGTVFELTPTGVEKVLYSFGSQSGDGNEPVAGVVLDDAGNLYGTTSQGGLYGLGVRGYGTVFEITGGTEKILYELGAQSGDGNYPIGGLVLDGQGNLYGTTEAGGSAGYGTVFEVIP